MESFDILIQTVLNGFSVGAIGPGDIRMPSRPFPALYQILTLEQQAILPRIADEKASATSDEIRSVGEALYAAIFTPAIATAYGEANGRAKGQLRLRLQIEPPELASLPWEAMHDGTGWLATRSGTPLVRRLGGMDKVEFPKKLGVKEALRILFVAASPLGVAPISIADIADDLTARLSKPIEEGHVELTVLLNASLEKDLRPVLTESEAYHIVYFLCHGRRDAICLDDGWGDSIVGDGRKKRDPGDPDWVTAESLALELQNEDVRLIFLSACETGGQPDQASGVMQNFAQTLSEQLTLPALVAMQYFVSDMQAAALTSEFLAHLAAFEPVDIALAEARIALIDKEEVRRDVIAPVMYLQAEESALFAKKRNWAQIGLFIFLPMVVLFAALFVWRTNQSQQKDQVTLALNLADIPKEGKDPETNLLWALEATRTMNEAREVLPEVNYVLRKSLASMPIATYRHEASRQYSPLLFFNSTGSRLVTASYAVRRGFEGTARLLDSTSGRELAVFDDGNQVEGIVFSPDGSHLAATISNTVRLLDSASGEELAILSHESRVTLVTFTLNGSQLVTVSGDETISTIHLWDIASGQPLRAVLFGNSISDVQISSNGFRLVITTSDQMAHLLDVATLQELASLGQDRSTLFSPDGSHFVVPLSDTLHLVSSADGKVLAVLSHSHEAHTPIFNAASTRLVTVISDSVHLWDSADGKELAAFPYMVPKYTGLYFNADGTRLAMEDLSDGVVHLIDSGNGKEVKGLPHDRPYPDIAFNVDGSRLATFTTDSIHLWDSADGREPAVFPQLPSVWKMFFNHDGSRLAVTTGNDGEADTLHLLDVTNTKELTTFNLSGLGIAGFSPDGSLLAFTNDLSSLQVVDAVNGNSMAILRHQARLMDFAFSPDGARIATGSEDGMVRLWNSEGGIEPANRRLDGWVFNVTPVEDGYRLTTVDQEGTARLLDLATGKELATFRPDQKPSPAFFNQNGSRLVTISPTFPGDPTLSTREKMRLIDVKSGKTLAVSNSDYGFGQVVFSGDGSRVALGDSYADTVVATWNSSTRTQLADISYSSSLNDMAFSADGIWFALALYNGTVRLWNVVEAKERPSLAHEGSVNDIAFSPDNSQLATASEDGTARLWDVASGNELRQLPHGVPVDGVVFSKDGNHLATWSTDNAVQVWDSASGKKLQTLRHNSSILTAVFSPTGSQLAVYSEDSRIHIWDSSTGNELDFLDVRESISIPSAPIEYTSGQFGLVFDADGSHLLTVSFDGVVRKWQIGDSQGLSEIACGALSRNMSQQEWREFEVYIGKATIYHQTCNTLPVHWTVVEAMLTQGLTLVQAGDVNKAVAIFQEALELDPNLDQLRIALRMEPDGDFRFYLRLGRPIDAQGLAAQALVDEAATVAGKGDIEAANVLFNKALTLDPALGPQLLAAKKRAAQRLQEDAKLRAKTAGVEDVAVMAALFQMAMELDPSLNLDPLVEAKSLVIDSLMEQGNSSARAGNIEEAIVRYQEVLRLNPDIPLTPDAYARRLAAKYLVENGRALERDDKFDQAREIYTQAIEADPSNAGVYYAQRGYTYEKQQAYASAVTDYSTAINLHPERSAAFYYRRGVAYFQQSRYEEAVADFSQAIELTLQRRPGGAKLVTPEYSFSLAYVTVSPQLGYWTLDQAYYKRGTALVDQGLYTQAVQDFNEAIQRSPDQLEYYNGNCWFGALFGHAADVMDSCDRTVGLAPDNAGVRDSRGLARALVGDLDGAVEDFEFAVKWAEETGYGAAFIESRTAWIEALKAGENPFEDEGLLTELRQQ